MKALFLYINLQHLFLILSQTMVKNHKLFGNTSITFMVGKVILLIKNVQQLL